MDVRHFELQDMLADALIALEAGDHAKVEATLRKALAWVEHDWLATPGEIRIDATRPTLAAGDRPTLAVTEVAATDDEDDE